MAALSAGLASKVTAEPTVIVLCITMVLTVQNIRTNQKVSILTAVLGAIAALLSLPEKAKVGALDVSLWIIMGTMIGLAALSALVFMSFFAFDSSPMRRRRRSRKRKARKPSGR